jgi:Ca2+-transporting ATPase
MTGITRPAALPRALTPRLEAAGAHAYSAVAADVLRDLDVDPARGLSGADAAARAQTSGANAIQHVERPRVWRMLLTAATQPFVLLLLAAGVGAILLGEVRDGSLVLLGLIPIVGADVVTEYRGERALEALRAASAPAARVRRDRAAEVIPAADIVPGDIVLLRAGDVVPADLRLTRVDRLVIDRSVMTGESVPEPASVDADGPEAALADRRSVAYAGTSVIAGRGEGVTIATGARTELGQIAGGLATKERRRSPLQLELDRLVGILLAVAIGLILVTVGLGFARGNAVADNLLAGISAAIAAIPEEPPVLVAVILGLGAYRLLRRGVLVRRLNAEEVLGAVNLVVTDKTGTLTQNRLEVASVCDPGGECLDGTRRLVVLMGALRAEDDAYGHADGIGTNSFTTALRRAVEEVGGDAWPDRDELVAAQPADDAHPFASTTTCRDGVTETLMLGAPEAIADLVLGVAGAERCAWHAAIERATSDGQRVVALARRVAEGPAEMVSLIGFADPLRPGIPEAATAAGEAGIHVVIVTGDHPTTATAIARQAGLDDGGVVLGSEVDGWSDAELAARIDTVAAVARSTPDQKRRIVQVARSDGRLVAVTGDGVNDAPALHGADVAVAMGTGTAVAKEASDLVLGDDSFATLIYGIREGRRIVDNVQKGLVFLVSTHVALLGFIFIATVAGFDQPLLPIQILWLELFIDIAASVAFEREPAEPALMSRRPRPVGRPLLTRGLLARVAVAGGFSAVAALWLMVALAGPADHTRWLAYTTLVCAQAVRAYANRSLQEPIHRLAANWLLLSACIATIAVQALIPVVPALQDAFDATVLDAKDWGIVAVIALAPAVLAQAMRAWAHRTWVA